MESTQKRQIALKYRLHGLGFYKALEAMSFAQNYHSGFRKDGITPEFSHQIAIASYLCTLNPWLIFAERTIAVAFLHDVCEDYEVDFNEIKKLFGEDIKNDVVAMTKEVMGTRLPPEVVFHAIEESPCASIAKLADRIHNQNSMVGVFTPTKMGEYIKETKDYFFPMMKRARELFPLQEPAYENAKLVLESQINMVEAIIRHPSFRIAEFL